MDNTLYFKIAVNIVHSPISDRVIEIQTTDTEYIFSPHNDT